MGMKIPYYELFAFAVEDASSYSPNPQLQTDGVLGTSDASLDTCSSLGY